MKPIKVDAAFLLITFFHAMLSVYQVESVVKDDDPRKMPVCARIKTESYAILCAITQKYSSIYIQLCDVYS